MVETLPEKILQKIGWGWVNSYNVRIIKMVFEYVESECVESHHYKAVVIYVVALTADAFVAASYTHGCDD